MLCGDKIAETTVIDFFFLKKEYGLRKYNFSGQCAHSREQIMHHHHFSLFAECVTVACL